MKAQGKQYSEGAACFALVINKYQNVFEMPLFYAKYTTNTYLCT